MRNNEINQDLVKRTKVKFWGATEPTCFYCGINGHTPNACYVRNFSVAQGHYVWVKKGTNFDGTKAIWVPNKT